jgi:hypothetical protein
MTNGCRTGLAVICAALSVAVSGCADAQLPCVPGVTCPPPDNTPPPPPPPTTRRFEESDPSVSAGPGWLMTNPDDWFAWSGGRAGYSAVPTARATLSFTGRSATWIGYRSVDSGIARVFVDGAPLARFLTV